MDTAAIQNASRTELTRAVMTLGRKAKSMAAKVAVLKDPAFQLMEAGICTLGGVGAAALVAMRAKNNQTTQIMNIDLDAGAGALMLGGGIAMMASSSNSKVGGAFIEAGKGAIAYWAGTKTATAIANRP